MGSIGSAGAVISGQGGAQHDLKHVNKIFKLKHTELRQKSKRLQRPIKPGDEVIKIGKFEGYCVTSTNKNSRAIPFHQPIIFSRDAKDLEEFNFPQIHNLKSDLEDILQRRASYI